jgi:hypothetical protein
MLAYIPYMDPMGYDTCLSCYVKFTNKNPMMSNGLSGISASCLVTSSGNGRTPISIALNHKRHEFLASSFPFKGINSWMADGLGLATKNWGSLKPRVLSPVSPEQQWFDQTVSTSRTVPDNDALNDWKMGPGAGCRRDFCFKGGEGKFNEGLAFTWWFRWEVLKCFEDAGFHSAQHQ